MPARGGKSGQKRHHFSLCFIIKIKTKLAALFLTEHFFNIYNRRDRMFYDSGNLLDDRGKTIDKYPFIQLKSNSKIKLPCNLHCFLKILIRNRTSSYHSTIMQNAISSIQCNYSIIRYRFYFTKITCRPTGSYHYFYSPIMSFPKSVNRRLGYRMSLKTQ